MSEETERLAAAVARVRPRTRAQLRGWVRAVLGVKVPGRSVCPEHCPPLDYLDHVFFEREGDALVWANRGGGKTFYGAIATLLDLLFKPGVQVRILGGSLEQSGKMYAHLRWMLEKPGLREQVAGKLTSRGVELKNGSRVELLSQSERSVRGQRVQKLRCDEVELFDRDVWAAAQFVTRSAICGGAAVRGGVEVMSTMHRPYGLMSDLIKQAREAGNWRVLSWCVLDVMERCEVVEPCEQCGLFDACGGRAKSLDGFVQVADVLGQMGRSSREAFEAEMLCRRPGRSDAVLRGFDVAKHVREVEADPRLRWVGGIDFGMRAPFVMLWAQLREVGDGRVCVEVMDEMVVRDRTVEANVGEMRRRVWPSVEWVGVDPAGHQRSDQTGTSSIAVLKAAGYRVRSRRQGVAAGIEVLRARIEPADEAKTGGPLLRVHPRCVKLIESLVCYHYDADRPERPEPVKDGFDHAVDALRYLVTNLDGGREVVVGRY